MAYNRNVVFIETSIFTKEIKRLLPDDDETIADCSDVEA